MSTSSNAGTRRQGWRRIVQRFAWLPVAGIVAVAATAPLPTAARADNAPENGIAPMCKNGGTNGESHYVLTAGDGYILTPDNNSIYMWSYSNGSDAFQYPGPALCLTEGDSVTITLVNKLPVPTSFNVLGITGQSFSGVDADGSLTGTPRTGPATPSAQDLKVGNLVPSVAPGGSATYSFVASHAGTYLYESGTSPELQDQMGLVGAMIVRPCTDSSTKGACTPSTVQANRVVHPDYVYDPSETGWDPATNTAVNKTGLSTQFNTDREFLHLLSEVDPDLHSCFEEARFGRSVSQQSDGGFASRCNPTNAPFTYDLTQYKARYWFINGRSFPDTVDANNAEHLPAQPFSSLVHVSPRSANDVSPAVVRYLNAGPIGYPFHPHAQHESVIGVDGRPRVAADPANAGGALDLSEDHFGLTIPPGQTVDAFFSWVDAVGWDPVTRPIAFGGTSKDSAQSFSDLYQEAPGVIVPQEQDKVNGEFWSGTPYLGYQHSLKPGELQFNQCGEYYDVAHSHALYQVTNFGSGIGGMLTMVRIDPITGCKGA